MLTLAEVAYHEAGHAVLTLRCGRKLESVWIGDSADDGGNSQHYDPLWHKSDATGVLEIAGDDMAMALAGLHIALAGVYAQRKFTGNAHIPMAKSDKHDVENFFVHSSLSDADIRQATREAKANTKSLVAHYWSDIERVAAALLERRKLSGDEVRELLSPELKGVAINGVCLTEPR
jgi:hypothetical protein